MKNSRISKMNGMKYTAAALAVAALQSGLALADTTTTATAATAGAQTAATASASTFDKVSEKLLLNYWGYYQGAAVNDPGNAFAPNVDGTTDTSSAQVIENIVNAGTHLDKDTNLYVGIHSFYYPRGKADGDGNVEGSADIQMLDPAIVLTRANLINTGGLKLKGYFSVVPAMETADFMKPKHISAASR